MMERVSIPKRGLYLWLLLIPAPSQLPTASASSSVHSECYEARSILGNSTLSLYGLSPHAVPSFSPYVILEDMIRVTIYLQLK